MIDTLRGSLSVLALVSGLAGAPLTEVDDQLPLYAPVEGVSGALTSVGSDTMNDVMTLWMEGFLRLYPGAVRGSIEGRGSATAPPALLHGRSNLAPMSRRMNEGELRAFEKQRGYRPTEIAVGIDMLAVFVHADNPLRSLDLVELDAIFSRTREGGAPAALDGWSDLGLDGVYARLHELQFRE